MTPIVRGQEEGVQQTSAMQPVEPAKEASVRREDASSQERSVLVKPH
jgi:hypothetical protein